MIILLVTVSFATDSNLVDQAPTLVYHPSCARELEHLPIEMKNHLALRYGIDLLTSIPSNTANDQLRLDQLSNTSINCKVETFYKGSYQEIVLRFV